MEDTKQPMIHALMAKCMAEIKAVGKWGENKDQGYAFRAVADVYRAAQPVMASNGVHFAPFAISDYQCSKYERSAGKFTFHVTMKVEHRFYAPDGSFIPCVTIGEGMDYSDKASNKAMTASAKYAVVQSFCLPEKDADGDAESPSADNEGGDPFEPLWTALEALGLKEPTAVKAWCEAKLGRPLPAADSLTLADLPKLMAEAKRPATPEPPVRHKASKEEVLRLAAHLDVMGIAPHDPAKSKKENQDASKAAYLAWVNGMRKPAPMVGGLLELYADEIIPMIAKAKAGERPKEDDMPAWMDEAKESGASEVDIDK
jgi:hypothetical protein